MSLLNKELMAVAIAAAKGEVATNFSNKDLSDKIREKMVEEFGTSEFNRKVFRKNQTAIFEFVEETIAPIVNDRTQEVFGRFAEYRNLAFGDVNKFFIEDIKTFPIATISTGNGNVLRHRLDNQELTIKMDVVGAGVYEELVRFMAGRTDWAVLTARLAESFIVDINKRITEALYGAMSKLSADWKKNGAFSGEGELKAAVLEIADKVDAAHGNAIIVGTKQALRKLKPEFYSDVQAGERNNVGIFSHVDGYETLELPQFFKAGTEEFGVDNDIIFVLPNANEKIVKVVQSGDYEFLRTENGSETYRTDMQVTHDVITSVGVAVLTGAYYGAVEIAG